MLQIIALISKVLQGCIGELNTWTPGMKSTKRKILFYFSADTLCGQSWALLQALSPHSWLCDQKKWAWAGCSRQGRVFWDEAFSLGRIRGCEAQQRLSHAPIRGVPGTVPDKDQELLSHMRVQLPAQTSSLPKVFPPCSQIHSSHCASSQFPAIKVVQTFPFPSCATISSNFKLIWWKNKIFQNPDPW